MLSLEHIKVTLDEPFQEKKTLFNDFNLRVSPREFLVIVGHNGSGKSTLFNVISGWVNPSKGRIMIQGQDVTELSLRDRAPWVSKVMQDPRLGTVDQMSIFENMALALHKTSPFSLKFFQTAKQRQLFQEKLSLLEMGLEDRMDTLAGSLSGGQRQGLSLMMATLSNAPILLLDEITAALDPENEERIMEVTHKMVRHFQKTCLMITHRMHHAATLGDRTIFIRQGHIIQTWQTPQEDWQSTLKQLHELLGDAS